MTVATDGVVEISGLDRELAALEVEVSTVTAAHDAFNPEIEEMADEYGFRPQYFGETIEGKAAQVFRQLAREDGEGLEDAARAELVARQEAGAAAYTQLKEVLALREGYIATLKVARAKVEALKSVKAQKDGIDQYVEIGRLLIKHFKGDAIELAAEVLNLLIDVGEGIEGVATRFHAFTAKNAKSQFDAYVKAGFSDEHAIQLVLKRSNDFTAMMNRLSVRHS